MDVRGLRVARRASIVAAVGEFGFVYRQMTFSLLALFRPYLDASPRCVVIDHFGVVVPQHVLRRRWALQQMKLNKYDKN